MNTHSQLACLGTTVRWSRFLELKAPSAGWLSGDRLIAGKLVVASDA